MPAKKKKADSGKKRRVTEQLQTYWKKIKGKQAYPSLADIHPSDIREIWQDCFMVEIGEDRHHYTYLGDNICDMFGGDLTGTSVLYLCDSLAQKYFEVVKSKKPVSNEDEFTNLNNQEIKFRQILLPIGENKKVDHILGAMRYKKED